MRITRFEFNQLNDFRPKADHFAIQEIVADLAQQEAQIVAAPTFSEAQLEDAKAAARKQGYNEGFEAGSAVANQEMLNRERDMKTALEALAERIHETQRGYDHLLSVQSRDINQFVLAIARKIAGEALTTRPDLAIQELINMCLPILMHKPRLVLEANKALVESLQDRLKPMLERAGFEGDVQFRVNDHLEPSDTRLEWNGGYAERNTAALWKEIEDMLAHVTFYPEITKDNATPHTENKE